MDNCKVGKLLIHILIHVNPVRMSSLFLLFSKKLAHFFFTQEVNDCK